MKKTDQPADDPRAGAQRITYFVSDEGNPPPHVLEEARALQSADEASAPKKQDTELPAL